MKPEIKIIEPTLENIKMVEKMRTKEVSIPTIERRLTESYEAWQIKEGNYLVFGLYIQEKIFAVCYVGKTTKNKLFIESLFIKSSCQKLGLHLKIRKILLQYILENKNLVEEYFACQFEEAIALKYSEALDKTYSDLGFEEISKNHSVIQYHLTPKKK